MQSPADNYKSRVRAAFSSHVHSYDQHAKVQEYAADHSAQLLLQLKEKSAIPEGDFLEIGCGTGLFTERLMALFPQRKIICSDISSAMVDACKQRLKVNSVLELHPRILFQTIDAEELSLAPQYSLIASSFVLQWFFHPLEGIARLLQALIPGGVLLFSVPGDESCQEWREASQRLDIPYTRNPLLKLVDLQDIATEHGMEFRLQDNKVEEVYADAASMLRSFKELGAGTQRNNLEMTPLQMRRLLRELDEHSKPLQTSHQVITGYFRRKVQA